MPASIAATKADLYTRLTDAAIAGVDAVFDHEPAPGGVQRGVTITISTFGITAETWQVALRVYADVASGAKAGQDNLDTIVPLVEAELLTISYAGPLAWEFDLLDAQLVATCILDVGREDYF